MGHLRKVNIRGYIWCVVDPLEGRDGHWSSSILRVIHRLIRPPGLHTNSVVALAFYHLVICQPTELLVDHKLATAFVLNVSLRHWSDFCFLMSPFSLLII